MEAVCGMVRIFSGIAHSHFPLKTPPFKLGFYIYLRMDERRLILDQNQNFDLQLVLLIQAQRIKCIRSLHCRPHSLQLGIDTVFEMTSQPNYLHISLWVPFHVTRSKISHT